MITIPTASALSDGDLVAAAARLAAEGRQVTADLIALLAVLVERKLYAAEGYGTAHDFCVRRLLLSDAQAYHRLAAAQVAWRFPTVLPALREGRLTLTSVALLRPHLTDENAAAALAWADRRSKREVELYVRGLAPLPDVAPSLRRLPTAAPAVAAAAEAARPLAPPALESSQPSLPEPLDGSKSGEVHHAASLLAGADGEPPVARLGDGPPTDASAVPVSPPPSNMNRGAARPVEIRPLTPSRYSLRLTITEATHAKLRRAADLLGHTVPSGDLAEVLDRALTLLVEQLERRKYAARKPTRPDGDGSPELQAPRDRRQPRPVTPPERPAEAGLPGSDEAMSRSSCEGAATPPASGTRRSRYIPAAVRREVYLRDQGRCTYIGPAGRCSRTRRLEFHHRVPFVEGGPPTASNVALTCRTHNRAEAARWFGEDFDRSKRSARTEGPTARGT